ncbi:MAG: hypothetical protein HAW66_09945 [Shewanella sp.]|nr:hypothetical protein [Shewanella sp.]
MTVTHSISFVWNQISQCFDSVNSTISTMSYPPKVHQILTVQPMEKNELTKLKPTDYHLCWYSSSTEASAHKEAHLSDNLSKAIESYLTQHIHQLNHTVSDGQFILRSCKPEMDEPVTLKQRIVNFLRNR